MVDRYWRKIESVENDVENSMQISSILLKLKAYDEKLSDLSKIDDNSNNISSNLEKIDENKEDISSNLKKINANKSDIATNYNNINTNKNDMSSNKNDITNNSSSISINKNNIETNTNLINTNKSSYNLNEIYINDIKSGNQTVNIDNHFHIFEKEIINDFKKDSILEIILKVLTEISNYVLIGFFQILCNFYDDNNNVCYTILIRFLPNIKLLIIPYHNHSLICEKDGFSWIRCPIYFFSAKFHPFLPICSSNHFLHF